MIEEKEEKEDTGAIHDADDAKSTTEADLKHQIEVLQDKLLRVAAENENIRRRYEKQLDETREYSVISFAKDLMSVMDNLSRALDHKPSDLDEHMRNFVAGVEMTKTELSNVFAKHGVEEISPEIGGKFDYNLHHAISQMASDEHPQGSVLQLMQVGYKIKDRLLRPAAVSVVKPSA